MAKDVHEDDGSWRKARGESPSRRQVRRLTEKGYTARQIAEVMQVTTQAVYQHQRAIRAADAEESVAS